MIYSNGEIKISPKIIYWVEIPSIIGDYEKFELLKQDIFLVEYTGEISQITELVKTTTKFTAYFFNLDKIIEFNEVDDDYTNNFIVYLAEFISQISPDKSLIHTN